MSCHGPLQAWFSRERTPAGKRRIGFKFKEVYHDLPVTVPCGRCNGCKLERSREWAVRCVHEASMWKDNCFVTLTYNDRNLPKIFGVPTLRPRDFVLFMKKLRKVKPGVRFLQAGEYGKLGRPHHHAILFNCSFDSDKVIYGKRGDYKLYRSPTLERLWTCGFSSFGSVTFESAAYVARYTLKKVSGSRRGFREDEYCTMSRNPGIGASWFNKFVGDVFPSDEVVTRGGIIGKPPRYYDELYRRLNPVGYADVKRRRIRAIDDSEIRGSRLYAKQELCKRRIDDYLKRSVE